MGKKPSAEYLAAIAVQFITAGDDPDVALARANKLYCTAVKYLKAFDAMTPLQQAVDIDEKATVQKLLTEGSVPALDYFRSTAKTKTERNISYNAFINLIQR